MIKKRVVQIHVNLGGGGLEKLYLERGNNKGGKDGEKRNVSLIGKYYVVGIGG